MIDKRIILIALFLAFLLAASRIHKNLVSAQTAKASLKPTPSQVLSPVPSVLVSTTPRSSSAPTQNSESENLKDWIYPNSKVDKTSDDVISLESGDDPTQIGSWYKDKMNQGNFTTRSFSTVNSNNNIVSSF